MYDLPHSPPKHIQYLAQKCESLSILGSIIKFPPNKGPGETYVDLVCTDEDQANIYEIISTIADNGKLSLLLKQSYLKNLGAQVNHVHPLKFLSTIFTNHTLKEQMYDIFDDYFKRNGFLDGLVPSLNREADKGKLEQYVGDFSKDLELSPENLLPFFQKRDWENFVRYLIHS
jgi:hypothetical protein